VVSCCRISGLLIASMAALAVGLSFRADAAAVFRNGALVQAFPVGASVVLATIRDGSVNLTSARYGAFFAWFVFMACALSRRHAAFGAADGRPAIVR
jgi:hypothetical protein